MTRTFKVLSALLSYPTAELQQAAGEMKTVLAAEKLLPAAVLRAVLTLLDEIESRDLYDLQERYVLLFDRTRSLSLHLFEHVHGESRDRGQAMIDLQNLYAEKGLEIGTSELPDFVPLFLEFLSTRPRAEAYDLLGQPVHILAALAERLRKRDSSYESVFRALVSLAKAKPKGEDVAAILSEPDPDADDFAALDAAWEDAPVQFGPNAGGGCKDGLIARVRAGLRPAPGMPETSRPVLPTR
ncbi:MAG: nitrate reductase molybdenum cofactor assembly chaperone [Pseudorhodoplanes sp.]|jgi:nitrate reductase delta subunit|nr:nitrate reductase molybdenum cofactor assembly chaperone [Pseudorhodoplanes sp.]